MLLTRLTSLERVGTLETAAAAAAALEVAADRLGSAGVGDPRSIWEGYLSVVSELATSLCVIFGTMRDIAGAARLAAADLHIMDENCRIVEALKELLGLDRDPSIGTLRLACMAAELCAEVEPMWQQHRRLGLERHVDMLQDSWTRRCGIETRLREQSQLLDLSDASPALLHGIANILRQNGPLAFARSKFRSARRHFMARWKGGPTPNSREWPIIFEDAAAVLAERESFCNDATLRSVLGEGSDLLAAPLSHLAAAAAWQRKVCDQLAGDKAEISQLPLVLLTVDSDRLSWLAQLASAAHELRNYLDNERRAKHQSWSAFRGGGKRRADALAHLARFVSVIGLLPEVPANDLEMLASAHHQWRAASAILESPSILEFLSPETPITS